MLRLSIPLNPKSLLPALCRYKQLLTQSHNMRRHIGNLHHNRRRRHLLPDVYSPTAYLGFVGASKVLRHTENAASF